MREHIEQALRALPLSEADIASVASRLQGAPPLLQEPSPLRFETTTFFDFRSKVTAMVEHFSADGLTLKDYLRAAVKKPSLFYQSPVTLQANIEGVVEHFHKDGLMLKDYLRAAIKHPPLFYQSSPTVQANIEGVARHFRKDGLLLKDYVRAAVKQPQLFTQSPATVQANIEGGARQFGKDGLTLKDYLRAAVWQPPLFCMSPAKVRANIEEVVEHFRKDGLTLKDYLQAALRQPQLFYQRPATIIRHVRMIADLYAHGLVRFRGQEDAEPSQPLKPLFDFLVANPACFCLADKNIALRAEFSRLTGTHPKGATLLTWSRSRVERELRLAQGPA